MSCPAMREQIDAYVDGELAAAERRRFDDHLRSCLPCRREVREWERLLSAARKLPGIEPQRNLWPGIEARIGGGRQRPPAPRWIYLAAAAVLALAVILPRALEPPESAPPSPAAVSDLPGWSEAAHRSDGTLHIRNDLRRELEKRRDLLAPETLSTVEEDLRVLDLAVVQISAALEDDPFNRHLSSLLAARYQQEAQVLKRISRI